MLSSTNRTTIRIFLAVLSAGLIVHSVLGLYTIFNAPQRFRLKARHVGDVEVRGRTYHIHHNRPVDMKHQTIYLKRRQITWRPHLAARRSILGEAPSSERSLSYHKVGGETGGLQLNCQTCAIIGYSALLLGSGHGKDIDQFQCVFRMGLSPVKGFEKDVGSKTTLRILEGKSFDLLIRRPAKLVTGTQSSPTWIVFNHKDLDGVFKIQLKLPEIRRQHPNVTVYTLTRSGENAALRTLREEGAKLGYKMLGATPSTLWNTVQALSDAGCSETKVFGVLDSKYCKRTANENIRRTYWDRFSAPSCSDGADSGLQGDVEDHTLSLNDRRALLAWSRERAVAFASPQWPLT